MLRKKSRQRGAVLTEYIIILSFIAAIASSFVSDGGLVDAAKEAAAIAKEDIIVALGGERPSKNNKNYTFVGEAEKFETIIPAMIDDIYTTFGTQGKLASIKYNFDEGISEIKYYQEDGSVISVTNVKDVYGVDNITTFFKDDNYTMGRPHGTGYLAFDQEGNVIKNLSKDYINGNNVDGKNFYSNLTFYNQSTGKKIEIECDQNGKSPNTFSKVDNKNIYNDNTFE